MNSTEEVEEPFGGWAAFIDNVRLRIGGREDAYATRAEAEQAVRGAGLPTGEAEYRRVKA